MPLVVFRLAAWPFCRLFALAGIGLALHARLPLVGRLA
jgi:hypothetical protein